MSVVPGVVCPAFLAAAGISWGSQESTVGEHTPTAQEMFQVTGRGYFFPRSPSGHFPGECFLALCVGTAPFLILAVSSVQTSWYS